MPTEFGGLPLLVSPNASLKYWRRDLRKIDRMLLSAAQSLVMPGDVVWDVGANVGLFSYASLGLAGSGGQVLAVEPDPWLAGLICESARMRENAGRPIRVLTAAVGEQLGVVVLNIAQRGRATNFLSGVSPSSQAGGVRASVNVVCVNLDWLLDRYPAPAVLKVDVEGAEALVLRGARALLRDVRPKIVCEVSEQNRPEVTSMLLAAGYRLFDAEKPLRGAPPLSQCCWNTIALPDGQKQSWIAMWARSTRSPTYLERDGQQIPCKGAQFVAQSPRRMESKINSISSACQATR
jgi:FkbM family methyltransferase